MKISTSIKVIKLPFMEVAWMNECERKKNARILLIIIKFSFSSKPAAALSESR